MRTPQVELLYANKPVETLEQVHGEIELLQEVLADARQRALELVEHAGNLRNPLPTILALVERRIGDLIKVAACLRAAGALDNNAVVS